MDMCTEKNASVLMWNYHSEKYTSEICVGVNFKPKIYNEHKAWYLRSTKYKMMRSWRSKYFKAFKIVTTADENFSRID